jgi:membrane protein DedA with SNARE-associated domain
MTVAGCAIWSVGFVVLGIAAGAGWESLGSRLGGALLAGTVLVVLAFLARGARRRGIG